MRGRSVRTRRRRGPRKLWPVLGLTAVGVAVAVAASRRRRSGGSAEWDAAGRDPHSQIQTDPPVRQPRVQLADGLPVWLAGPAGNLYVRDTGEPRGDAPGATPVVFVHALAGNGGQWSLQLDHLRGARRAVALDLRGHGDSDPAEDGDYGVDALTGDVVAVADQLALRRFVLAGHSLGGLVAIRYAALHPGRVAGLLLADPNGDQTRLPAAQLAPFLAAIVADPVTELESYFRQLVLGGDREVASWVLEDLRSTHEAAISGALAAATRHSPLPDLARYPGPKVTVISDMNSLPYSLHNLVPGLPVELMPGTGHWLMMDRPRVFNRILDDFLDQVEGEVPPPLPG
jgi:pimeloyl-ACP methyl ester carboxylesterase